MVKTVKPKTKLRKFKDRLVIVDDQNHVCGIEHFRENGLIDIYQSGDNFRTHSHDVYSSMDAYIDAIDAAFMGLDGGGDVMSRKADIEPRYHRWIDRDGLTR